MGFFRKLPILILAALAAVMTAPVSSAEATTAVSITQTVRSLHQNQFGIRGDYLISYSTLNLRGTAWRLRGSVSWLSWQDGGGSTTIPDDSGPGSIYLTVGRRLWRSWSGSAASSGWLRLRGKLPLQRDFDVTGSGKADWGASLFTTHRLGALSILAEAGYMNLGQPQGMEYDALTSGSVSASYHCYGDRFYPIVGYALSTPARAGDPVYAEWTTGMGAVASSRLSFSALYSRGTTEISPRHSFAFSVALRQ